MLCKVQGAMTGKKAHTPSVTLATLLDQGPRLSGRLWDLRACLALRFLLSFQKPHVNRSLLLAGLHLPVSRCLQGGPQNLPERPTHRPCRALHLPFK